MPICKSLGHRLALKLYNYSWAHEWLRNKYYAMSECFWMLVFCAAFNTQILSDTYPAWQPISNCDLAQRKSGTVWLHKLSVYIVIQHHIIIIPINEANPDISGCNLQQNVCIFCVKYAKHSSGRRNACTPFLINFGQWKLFDVLAAWAHKLPSEVYTSVLCYNVFWKLYRSN